MNTNMIADAIYGFLKTKHERVYRNTSTSSPTFPYVVYRIESVMDNTPSEDFYVHVDIYEDTNKSVRVMEDLADSIDNELNDLVMNTDGFNAHFMREGRQFVDGNELISEQGVFLRYNTRIYFK
ncbi:hypothetical protein SAMN05421839_1067 [Halolactibacillus halophilus]|uniref:Uncharacterized protein n=1 Tax=Halolactibacillus halophilus TaxID=306540 RepID=A0A1I5MLC9_9BACI|nr:hypothetical protein [Halolactibacillus halophilus]GEM02498.1 hypothetical protein HHA03_20300 [Halolactibacillus halophilus]SFP10310.1 hypothetical protein SAMN05421839_1067 [Halolactibacillus halophilus]